MKAMILAAGRGSRMQPLTDHTPKPLLEVGGKPLIVWHIEKLQQAGFKEIIVNIAWLGDQIPKALGDGSQFGVQLIYSDEQQEGALETAGGIVKALPLLSDAASNKENPDEPFLVVNGDVWCDYKYNSDYINQDVSSRFNLAEGDLAHLILVKNPKHNPEGDFALTQQRVINVSVNENITQQKCYTFSGIGYYHPALFKNLAHGKRPLAPLLRHAMDENKVSGELYTGDWRDIGTPERLQVLDADLKSGFNKA